MTADEMTAAIEAEIQDEIDQMPQAPHQIQGFLGQAASSLMGTFADPLWLLYRKAKGVTWDRMGAFVGVPTIEVRGGREYVFRKNPAEPFRFVRPSGETIVPDSMVTDGGSVPRAVWCVPGLNPWDYMPAFLIHDWEFVTHHCNAGWPKSFEDVNVTLGEAIYTMMRSGLVQEDWRAAAIIVRAVSTSVAWRVWDAPWTQEQCRVVLTA